MLKPFKRNYYANSEWHTVTEADKAAALSLTPFLHRFNTEL